MLTVREAKQAFQDRPGPTREVMEECPAETVRASERSIRSRSLVSVLIEGRSRVRPLEHDGVVESLDGRLLRMKGSQPN